MRIFFWLGLVFFFGSIFLIFVNFDKLKIDKYGNIVKMRIVTLPQSCIGNKSRYTVVLSYNGALYEKSIKGSFCKRHIVGEVIEMRMLDGYSTILFPNETESSNLISFAILGLLGLIIALKLRKKMHQ